MRITLRQLEIFAEVLKSGSTTQASQQLALSQSAVSASLTDLEGQLGVQLFDRVGKRLVTNEHGRLLYPKALALLEQAGEIEQLFKLELGALRLAASSTIGNYMLPEMLAKYRQDFPDTPLELNISNTEDVIKAVAEFRVDLGLIEGLCHNPELITQPWMKDELIVFSSPTSTLLQHHLTVEDLINAPWILREKGSGTREVLDHLLFSQLPRFNIAMELGNSEAIKHAVQYGMGISCLSRRVVQEQLNNGTLTELIIPGLYLNRTLYLIFHRQKHMSNALQKLLSYCN
ncbi:LysR family transcriptional regulator [Xenorhabdus nematophila]|uniref:Transcriptional regulator with periplasmic binding protein domain (LysR familiy) n=1 Tax=Xenorhabdus nematophila (strain ATCC 19061 / DSM 3370 / CCUG 14189 / LMG 1036 / NCIMB 9965 / AN6) TaxID=406817 RepID=D3VIW0_XENNA|nr:DNA-binding transcriptional regulator YeiE [Xenorhabdus nematophila]CEE90245.1 putative transcriptional regulator with periplasmic binding protein domain (LysR familiy) [Xenorhabdus nematophila str. Anatoliense]CEF32155.1 putative transcriptional regulator with periplasmic binding protein domain (LysR familiy) [Xenorhabdus nematophila str. Websteri]AYA39906.1 LysR family transcriptional regulator [Xenorhabdus nematophila]KHD28060.1 transcriptional regulator [Xenorhabdus nematophila]MBA00184